MDIGPVGLGSRIRQIREQRRMSRPALVTAMGGHDGKPWMSVSYLKAIENGQKSLTNIQLIYRIAQALGVGPEMLQGLPDLLRHDGFENGGIPQLRRLLTPAESLGVVPRLFDVATTDLGEVQRQVHLAWGLFQAAEYGALGDALPEVLAHAQAATACSSGADADRANAILSEACNVTAMLLTKLGHYDLAFTASDSAAKAAVTADDPLARAAAAMHMCAVYFRQGRADDVYRLAVASAKHLDDAGIPHDQEYAAMTGALLLRGSVGAARMGVGRDAWHLHAEAETLARHVPPMDNCRFTLFNTTNAAMHAVSVAVDLGEPELALARQRGINLTLIGSKERANRHRVELARALQMREDWPALTAVLRAAAHDAPEEFRYGRFAREAIRTAWRTVDDRAGVPGLIDLAQMLGIAHDEQVA